MQDMLLTPEVSRPERSMEASEGHLSNMLDMLLTPEVSRPERSREVSFEQP